MAVINKLLRQAFALVISEIDYIDDYVKGKQLLI
jgi:hypothetical protein